ncbi:hypothetical protein [Novosphingobium clariflavum]|uniref:Secreted protein n=1 Tax=Novosphingobium clariflavum TaxID=2029884 RepID=A0ABV6SBA8_9SPHN|nr:hypothetical protein [Novosphingobium clariflavum]
MTFVGIRQSLFLVFSVPARTGAFEPLAPLAIDVRAKVIGSNTTAIAATIIGRIRWCDLLHVAVRQKDEPMKRRGSDGCEKWLSSCGNRN